MASRGGAWELKRASWQKSTWELINDQLQTLHGVPGTGGFLILCREAEQLFSMWIGAPTAFQCQIMQPRVGTAKFHRVIA